MRSAVRGLGFAVFLLCIIWLVKDQLHATQYRQTVSSLSSDTFGQQKNQQQQQQQQQSEPQSQQQQQQQESTQKHQHQHQEQEEQPQQQESAPSDAVAHVEFKNALVLHGTQSPRPAGYKSIPIDTPNDRIIVMARLSFEDTSWVAAELNEWRSMIYTVDDTSMTYHTPVNKGRESLAYLQYIVDHYYSLPSLIIFLHSHRSGWPQAWHTDTFDYSNVESVRLLRPDFVQKNGYVNLRCMDDPGCPAEIRPFRDPPDEGREAELYYARAYQELFNTSTVPEEVGVACCSQFAVSRDQVLKRPHSDYLRFYTWVLTTDLSDETVSRIMEYSWHIIFGMDAVYCPDVYQCYREVYGYQI